MACNTLVSCTRGAHNAPGSTAQRRYDPEEQQEAQHAAKKRDEVGEDARVEQHRERLHVLALSASWHRAASSTFSTASGALLWAAKVAMGLAGSLMAACFQQSPLVRGTLPTQTVCSRLAGGLMTARLQQWPLSPGNPAHTDLRRQPNGWSTDERKGLAGSLMAARSHHTRLGRGRCPH